MINIIKRPIVPSAFLHRFQVLSLFSQYAPKPLSYYYQVLGVNQSCTSQELKSAYLEMIKKYHPDLNKDPSAAERFRQVQKAYDYIQEASKKKQEQKKSSPQSQAKEKAKQGAAVDEEQAEKFQQIFKDLYSRKSRTPESMQFSYSLYKKHHEQMEKKKNQYIKVTGKEKEEWIHKNQPEGGSFWYTAGVGSVMVGLIGGAIFFVNYK